MSWQERLEEVKKQLHEAAEKLASYKLSRAELAGVMTLLSAERCMRCGTMVVPVFKAPGAYLCEHCRAEVKVFDGCNESVKWFMDHQKQYLDDRGRPVES